MEGISKSFAVFKFIAMSVTMDGDGSERWDGYQEERSKLLRFIKSKKISGIVFLSADLHAPL